MEFEIIKESPIFNAQGGNPQKMLIGKLLRVRTTFHERTGVNNRDIKAKFPHLRHNYT